MATMTNLVNIAQDTFAIIEANGYSINETFIKLSDNPSRLKDVCVCSPNKIRQTVSELGGKGAAYAG